MTISVKGPDHVPSSRAPEAAQRELPDHLLVWLEAAQRRVAVALDETVGDVVRRVPQRRLRILQLVPPDGARQKELAERALVTKQALAELVDALEADGLVERRPDPSDGRAWLVVRTAAGDRANETADRAMRTVEEILAQDIGEENYARFIDALRAIGEKE